MPVCGWETRTWASRQANRRHPQRGRFRGGGYLRRSGHGPMLGNIRDPGAEGGQGEGDRHEEAAKEGLARRKSVEAARPRAVEAQGRQGLIID